MFHEKDPSVDKDIIMSKLSKLRQYLNYLRELRKSSFEDLVSDFMEHREESSKTT